MKRSRALARVAGDQKYMTSKPCKRGHIAPRYTNSAKCIDCVTRNAQSWFERNKESRLKKIAEYRKVNKEKLRAAERRRLGLPEPTRPRPAFCELCGKNNKSGKALSLDHDHVSGKFRGWLCHRCNLSLGYYGDSVHGLRRAIAYLERAA